MKEIDKMYKEKEICDAILGILHWHIPTEYNRKTFEGIVAATEALTDKVMEWMNELEEGRQRAEFFNDYVSKDKRVLELQKEVESLKQELRESLEFNDRNSLQ